MRVEHLVAALVVDGVEDARVAALPPVGAVVRPAIVVGGAPLLRVITCVEINQCHGVEDDAMISTQMITALGGIELAGHAVVLVADAASKTIRVRVAREADACVEINQ